MKINGIAGGVQDILMERECHEIIQEHIAVGGDKPADIRQPVDQLCHSG
ncbi:hypothetical protein AFERRI_100210 [Acidithiobacillus ferrivorans]|uniref:Uncharacterized protein n=1 Tax=Acidithiobacillus ferrivorans TaxID=160808 RepID=A0A060UJT9_9PROT|nr:hypothetical protein AFERRI_100210 [Acidithiobacillus ferrivorans]